MLNALPVNIKLQLKVVAHKIDAESLSEFHYYCIVTHIKEL